MVEGPKVWLKKERLQVLHALRLVQCISYTNTANSTSQFSSSFPLKVIEICCVGKELFFLLEQGQLIRLHFGMNGSERVVPTTVAHPLINEADIQQLLQRHLPPLPKGYRKVLTTSLVFVPLTTDGPYTILYLYDTTLSWRTQNSDKFHTQYLQPLLKRDVMSTLLDIEEVTVRLSKSSVALMDSVLDQTIMPGVGNIIKCEGLFLAKLHPELVPSLLPVDKLRELVGHLRDFSWLWYNATKKHRDVTKLVYGKDQCTRCGSSIRLIRSGNLQRITYYCPQCQALDALTTTKENEPTTKIDTPTQNLLKLPWNCSFCSYENDCTQIICAICDGQQDIKIAAIPILQSEKVATASFEEKDSKKYDCDYTVSTLSPVLCKCGKSAHLQRVRKQGNNQHRLFWSCSSPLSRTTSATASTKRTSSCGVFLWADARFPRCPHHNPLSPSSSVPNMTSPVNANATNTTSFTILRRVLKAGPTNGRYFYTCSVPQCSFFHWEPIVSTAISAQHHHNLHDNNTNLSILGKRSLEDLSSSSICSIGSAAAIRIPL